MKKIHGSELSDGKHHDHHHECFSRRDFLKRMGLFTAGSALSLSGLPVQALASTGFFNQLASNQSDRVLVLVQLDGGNDGLNTIIPYENDRYYQLRPSLNISKENRINLNDTLALNSNLNPLYPLWNDGKMSIIQGVGYENPDMSHFRSMDIWQSGSHADEYLSTGWMGRFLEMQNPDFVDKSPEHPLAIQIGGSSSLLFNGSDLGMGITLPDLGQIQRLVDEGVIYSMDGIPNSIQGDEIRFLRRQANNSYKYADVIKNAYDSSRTRVTYQEDLKGQLNKSLSIVSRLIKGGIQTQIFMVTLNGFDTHAYQDADHPILLTDLGNAVKSFYDDLAADSKSNDVLIATFSEFGRRVYQNQSNGTDHGTSAPLFVFGDAVQGGFFGEDPKLDNQDLDDYGNMKHEFEFRQVYSSLLEDWFGIPSSQLTGVLGGEFDKIDFISGSYVNNESRTIPTKIKLHQNYPNPFNPSTTIRVDLDQTRHISIQIFDLQGRKVQQLLSKTLNAGTHFIPFNASQLASGTYIYRLQSENLSLSKKMTLIK